ncbi:ubiquitin recognition factor in ER-associated degradation protein 1 [Galendromus occidentalis]|uniref:Ubiquitin recognition factor in ER-associated degradation protein 1 n=1 Tax=Galendromus occidentalis TaxID=34638 RepID=A0AAJ6QXZ0_9ACAR|nr:ubiquitin recognition factor in ER-associated degradation protein 1 [Galendromus occidentalis]
MFNLDHFQDIHRKFTAEYRAFSVSMLCGNERQNLEQGNKVILPPSTLDMLSRLNITYPILFKVENRRLKRDTHCGVLEFSADEGKCYLPYWMMKYLCLDEGDHLYVENTQLPVGNFAKFQAQSVDFLDITNPKAVLENSLRHFACLTANDTIVIKYNDKQYELCVLETRPGPAIDIHECDLNVEFAAPVGYQEPETKKVSQEEIDFKKPEVIVDTKKAFQAFAGSGNRIDGKAKNLDASVAQGNLQAAEIERGVPDDRWKLGQINFIRVQFTKKGENMEVEDTFSAFAGPSSTLRQRKTTSTSSAAARPSRPPANSGGMWKFYTDDSPGFKVGPVPVLVMSVLFIFSVFVLHMYGKLTRG